MSGWHHLEVRGRQQYWTNQSTVQSHFTFKWASITYSTSITPVSGRNSSIIPVCWDPMVNGWKGAGYGDRERWKNNKLWTSYWIWLHLNNFQMLDHYLGLIISHIWTSFQVWSTSTTWTPSPPCRFSAGVKCGISHFSAPHQWILFAKNRRMHPQPSLLGHQTESKKKGETEGIAIQTFHLLHLVRLETVWTYSHSHPCVLNIFPPLAWWNSRL